ncbi:hypothetical protein BCR42DRAFT_423826, partial [Absidia repens]
MTNTTSNTDKDTDFMQHTDSSEDNSTNHSSNAATNDRNNTENNTDGTTTTTKYDLPVSINDLPELPEHYKNLQHNGKDNYHHPIPSLPPVPHHAPPEDSSELLSPWWSEELPEVTEQESENNQPNDLSHYLLKFQRQATDTSGKDVGQETCYLWTKEPQHQQYTETSLVNDVKKANITSSSLSLSHGYPDTTTTTSSNSNRSNNTKPQPEQQQQQQQPTLLNSQCAMVCLFRESQERKMKKRQAMNLSSSWNPFYGNWLVVVNSRSAFLEHIYETDITKKDSSDYYTMDVGEQLGQAGENVANFMTRTFLPLQELGRRYIESWRDGTQLGFFTKFCQAPNAGMPSFCFETVLV